MASNGWEKIRSTSSAQGVNVSMSAGSVQSMTTGMTISFHWEELVKHQERSGKTCLAQEGS